MHTQNLGHPFHIQRDLAFLRVPFPLPLSYSVTENVGNLGCGREVEGGNRTSGTVGCGRDGLDFMRAYVHGTLLSTGYVPHS
jgi:hypothetical protein